MSSDALQETPKQWLCRPCFAPPPPTSMLTHRYQQCGSEGRLQPPWHVRHRRWMIAGLATFISCGLAGLAVYLFVSRQHLTPQGSTDSAVTLSPPAPGAGGRGNSTSGTVGSNGGRVPRSPKHSQLITLAPCSARTDATVPLFVNEAWMKGNAKMTSAYIVQHGHLSDLDTYYEHAYPLVGQNAVLISPGLYHTDSKAAPKSWYEPSYTMAWLTYDSWSSGYDAVVTASTAKKSETHAVECSPFDAYDAILDRLADATLFPRMANVYFVGHSGGADLVSRYSQLNDEARHASLHMRYVVMNAPDQAYFDRTRPWPAAMHTCPFAFEYPYQMTNVEDKMPRYVKQHFDATVTTPTENSDSDDTAKTVAVLKRWLARDVALLTGDHDVTKQHDMTCEAESQGGPARRDRNYAYWAYQNLLAGTKTDVSQYSGYANLTDSLVSLQVGIGGGGNFSHQMCVVAGVGHNAEKMLKSDCGRGALFDTTLPPGAGPSFPTDAPTPDDKQSSRFEDTGD